MAINNNVDEEIIKETVAKAIEMFYSSLLAKIDNVSITDIMKRKNPYLYRVKAMQNAAEIVDSVLAATVSSSEETIFGNCFFEPLAIAACKGNKALAEGVDIMVQNGNTVHAIAVKSGTAVFNANSKKRQEQNFTAASKLARQANAGFDAIIGYCYGRRKQSNKGRPVIYRELAGQAFWSELTGDDQFYKKIIDYMGKTPEQYLETYKETYNRASNRLIKQFTYMFCDDYGNIDWNKLVEFNSGNEFNIC